MLKTIAGCVLGNKLVTDLANFLNQNSPVVLLYHGVTSEPPSSGIENFHGKHVEASKFAKQLDWLKKNFDLVPLSTIEDKVLGKTPPQKRLCAITFDDGYKNNFKVAFPLLTEKNIPATFFLTSNLIEHNQPLWIDRLEFMIDQFPIKKTEKIKTYLKLRQQLKNSSHQDRDEELLSLQKKVGRELSLNTTSNYSPLTWSEIKIMSEKNMAFGAHTLSHPILSKLNNDEQAKEIIESKKVIVEHLGSCPHFAYPNGQPNDWNSETLDLIKQAGWQTAWTTISRRVKLGKENSLILPRLTIANYHNFDRFRALVSGTLSR